MNLKYKNLLFLESIRANLTEVSNYPLQSHALIFTYLPATKFIEQDQQFVLGK